MLKLQSKYRFSQSDSLKHELRGKVFKVILVEPSYIRIQVYNEDGSLIVRDSNTDYWVADPIDSDSWYKYLDKNYSSNSWGFSKLEFKFV